MERYIKKGIPLHLHHFLIRAKNSGHWKEQTVSKAQLTGLLNLKIETVDFTRVEDDIQPFIPDMTPIEIWSPQYFKPG